MRDSHQDRDGRSVRYSLKPFPNTNLVCGRSKIPRCQDHCVLCSRSLAVFNHIYCVVYVLRCGTSNDRSVFESSIVQCFPLTLDQLMALFVLQEDGFAGAAQNHKTFDPTSYEEQTVLALRLCVD